MVELSRLKEATKLCNETALKHHSSIVDNDYSEDKENSIIKVGV